MHLWRRLGIARSNKFVGLCSRLAQTFIFMHLWRRLGIARSNKFIGLCSRLAQTFI